MRGGASLGSRLERPGRESKDSQIVYGCYWCIALCLWLVTLFRFLINLGCVGNTKKVWPLFPFLSPSHGRGKGVDGVGLASPSLKTLPLPSDSAALGDIAGDVSELLLLLSLTPSRAEE